MPQLLVGPILGVEANDKYTVCFSTEQNVGNAKVTMGDQTILPTHLDSTPNSKFWRAEFQVSVAEDPQELDYFIELDGQQAHCQNNRNTWSFYVPGEQEEPKFAYTSCNGFSSHDLLHKTEEPYRLWQHLNEQHGKAPFSVLLMGGDQLYADSIWSKVDELKEWNELSHKNKIQYDVADELSRELESFYDSLYQDRWSSPAMSLALATIPSIMMWDDHDIFDGWGSFPEELQNCAVFQEIFLHAKSYFELFQVRSIKNTSLLDPKCTAEDPNPDHYASALRFRDFNILSLDNRTQRKISQVMDPQTQWQAINAFLANGAGDGHLLILSAVPVVYRDFSFTESVMDATPWEEELTDDLKDHWRAKEHQGERARLIHRLLKNVERRSNENKEAYKTVILSGDVHIGCIGVIRDNKTKSKIHQVVSSGIVHPAPSRLQWIGIMAVTNDRDEVLDENGDITISMLKPFASDQYIRHRNYVTLLMGDDKKLWVNWESEGKDSPYYPIQ